MDNHLETMDEGCDIFEKDLSEISTGNFQNMDHNTMGNTDDTDLNFSIFELPVTSQLNHETSQHKRSLSKKGSISRRKRSTRAARHSIRQASTDDSIFMDSTEPPKSKSLSAFESDASEEETSHKREADHPLEESLTPRPVKISGGVMMPVGLGDLMKSKLFNKNRDKAAKEEENKEPSALLEDKGSSLSHREEENEFSTTRDSRVKPSAFTGECMEPSILSQKPDEPPDLLKEMDKRPDVSDYKNEQQTLSEDTKFNVPSISEEEVEERTTFSEDRNVPLFSEEKSEERSTSQEEARNTTDLQEMSRILPNDEPSTLLENEDESSVLSEIRDKPSTLAEGRGDQSNSSEDKSEASVSEEKSEEPSNLQDESNKTTETQEMFLTPLVERNVGSTVSNDMEKQQALSEDKSEQPTMPDISGDLSTLTEGETEQSILSEKVEDPPTLPWESDKPTVAQEFSETPSTVSEMSQELSISSMNSKEAPDSKNNSDDLLLTSESSYSRAGSDDQSNLLTLAGLKDQTIIPAESIETQNTSLDVDDRSMMCEDSFATSTEKINSEVPPIKHIEVLEKSTEPEDSGEPRIAVIESENTAVRPAESDEISTKPAESDEISTKPTESAEKPTKPTESVQISSRPAGSDETSTKSAEFLDSSKTPVEPDNSQIMLSESFKTSVGLDSSIPVPATPMGSETYRRLQGSQSEGNNTVEEMLDSKAAESSKKNQEAQSHPSSMLKLGQEINIKTTEHMTVKDKMAPADERSMETKRKGEPSTVTTFPIASTQSLASTTESSPLSATEFRQRKAEPSSTATFNLPGNDIEGAVSSQQPIGPEQSHVTPSDASSELSNLISQLKTCILYVTAVAAMSYAFMYFFRQ